MPQFLRVCGALALGLPERRGDLARRVGVRIAPQARRIDVVDRHAALSVTVHKGARDAEGFGELRDLPRRALRFRLHMTSA